MHVHVTHLPTTALARSVQSHYGGATDVRAPPAAASLFCWKGPCTLQIAQPAKPPSSGFIARSTRLLHVFVSHHPLLSSTLKFAAHSPDTSPLGTNPRSNAQLTDFLHRSPRFETDIHAWSGEASLIRELTALSRDCSASSRALADLGQLLIAATLPWSTQMAPSTATPKQRMASTA